MTLIGYVRELACNPSNLIINRRKNLLPEVQVKFGDNSPILLRLNAHEFRNVGCAVLSMSPHGGTLMMNRSNNPIKDKISPSMKALATYVTIKYLHIGSGGHARGMIRMCGSMPKGEVQTDTIPIEIGNVKGYLAICQQLILDELNTPVIASAMIFISHHRPDLIAQQFCNKFRELLRFETSFSMTQEYLAQTPYGQAQIANGNSPERVIADMSTEAIFAQCGPAYRMAASSHPEAEKKMQEILEQCRNYALDHIHQSVPSYLRNAA